MITAIDNRGIMAQCWDSGQCWDIDYGVDNQRMRSRFYTGHIFLQKTKYFANNYEKEVTTSKTREINYISTPYGTLAAFIRENKGSGQMYYLYKDHIGSITTITNSTGTVLERRSFDAWGRLRNPDNWSFNGTFAMDILDRGYTGHEHLPEFGLINMNGRMYDPLIGLMLSPDPYVSVPESMQGFNRYNYCLNNPLKYTDPDGEFIQYIIGAVMGAINGAIIGDKAGLTGGKLILATLAGAVIGAGTAGIGTAMSTSANFAVTGAVTGAAQSGSYALLSGVANGVNGGDLAKMTALSSLWGLASGSVGGAVSGRIGGGFGAFAGGFTSNLTQQGLDRIAYGPKYQFNIASPFISGAMSLGMYHINLAYHYKAGHIKESTGWNYRQFAKNMAYTQRSISKNLEVETITKGKGISYAEFGTKNSTLPTDCESYKGASSAYHTHQEFGYDEFSYMKNEHDYTADEWARKILDFNCGKSNMPMYLGTREGHIHFMNGGGIDGSINFNFLRIFVPNNYWLYYDYYTP